MAKIQFEANFLLDEEPVEFKNLQMTGKRTVYIWEDKRGVFTKDDPFIVWKRRSYMEKEPVGGAIELWEQTSEEAIPKVISDIWEEHFKVSQQDKVITEWHPSQKLLRLVWSQRPQGEKVLQQVAQLMKRWGLPQLSFPVMPQQAAHEQSN